MILRLARRLSALLWLAGLAALLAALALIGANAFLGRADAGDLLSEWGKRHFPDMRIRYQTAKLRFSFGGAHARIDGLLLTHDGAPVLRSPRADFWLDGDALRVSLDEPMATIPLVGGVGGGLGGRFPVIIVANNARLSVAGATITLDIANVAARRDSAGWRLRLSERNATRHFRLAADFDNRWRGRAAFEFSGPSPPGFPISWRQADVTLQADIGDNIAIVATGEWRPTAPEQSIPLTVAFSVAGAYRRDGGEQWVIDRARLSERRLGADAIIAGGGDRQGLTVAGVAVRAAAAPASVVAEYFSANEEIHRFAGEFAGEFTAAPVSLFAAGIWRQNGGEWALQNGRARLSNDETAVVASIAAAGVDRRATMAAIAGEFAPTPLVAIRRYLPPGETRDWFADSVAGGAMTDAKFFLAADDWENPIFRLTAAFTNGVIRVADGWPMARALSGAVAINNDDIRVDGEGAFGRLSAADVVARIPAAAAERATLRLNIAGGADSLAAHLETARQTPPIAAQTREATRALTVNGGRAMLSLSLAVPLAAPEKTAAAALLSLRHVALAANGAPPLIGVNGDIRFGNDQISGNLRGQPDNGRIDAPSLTIAFSADEMTVSGKADLSLILSVAGAAAPASGAVDFHLVRKATTTIFVAPLAPARIDWPAPLGKTPGEDADISVRLNGDNVDVAYHAAAVTVRFWGAGAGGDLAINAAPNPPPPAGVNIHGAAANVNLDEWLSLSEANDDIAIAAIMLTLHDATLLNNAHAELLVNSPPPAAGGRVVQLAAEGLEGEVSLAPGGVFARLSRLRLANDWATSGDGDNANPLAGLTLSATVATLVAIGGLTLGEVAVFGEPAGEDGWTLSRFQIRNDDIILRAAGLFDGANTRLTLSLAAPSLPKLMRVLDISDVISEGRISLVGNVAWPGPPTRLNAAKLNGQIHVAAARLRYTEISAGAGVINLLAIFSPQSLTSLGFTELGGGVVFDSVGGDIRLKNGVASSDNLMLLSDDLEMSIRGETDYLRQQHRLRGRVKPGEKIFKAGSAIGIGTGLIAIQPLLIFTAPVFGKVLESPISEIGAYEYAITGSWDDPVYEELGGDSPARQIAPNR